MYRFLCEPKFSFLWDKYVAVQFLGNMVMACLTSKKLSNCLPEWRYHFAFPISNVWMTQFFHISLSIFYFSHSYRCWVYFILVLIAFPKYLMMLNIFMFLFYIYNFFGEIAFDCWCSSCLFLLWNIYYRYVVCPY